ncbi:MAG: prepilin-type N-terminal cleavage/methylation domain-containing protein [bacterium]
MNKKRGFTLVELLVVIAIIGILSSVVLVSVQSARAKARDARRLSDLNQISTALELYYAQYEYYPKPGWGWRSECPAWGNLAANDVIPGLTPYFPSFPSDPAMDKVNNRCCYLYLSNGTNYALLMHNCPETNYQSSPISIDPRRDGGPNGCVVDGSSIWAWKISSPGGICW